MTPRSSCFVADTVMLRAVPGGTTLKSTSGTSAVNRTVLRSTTETMDMPGRTKPPGSMLRVATSPSKGARSTQSFTSRVLCESLAFMDSSSAASAALAAAFCSASSGETKLPASRSWTRADSPASALSRASMARADIATAWLAALASRQSSVASTSPRFTIAPGRTSTVSM